MQHRTSAALMAIAIAFAPAQSVWAQETTSLAPRAENGKQIYEAAQFARFAPQTAFDMVRQIPGFRITDVSGDRGLGEATQNVLVNGQRITGKGNDAETVLARTPVSSVVQIEIADGAAFSISGINGQVLNLVTKQGGIKGNYSWRPEYRRRTDKHMYKAEINISGKLGKGDFTLGLNNLGGYRGGGWFNESDTSAAGTVLSRASGLNKFDGDRPRIAATYSRKSDAGSIFNANGSFELYRYRQFGDAQRVPLASPASTETRRGREDEWNFELGSDYEFAAFGGRLKLVGFERYEHSAFKNSFVVSGAPATGRRFDQIINEGESVGRAEFRWKKGKADWQISAEAAYNFLDANSGFFRLDSGGVFQPVPLPNASAKVEEKRAQLIASYGRPLSTKLSMQATLGGEYSELGQSGASGLKRQFLRPKGSVQLNWTASPHLTTSLKLQRKVWQLDFGDFLASVDVRNSNSNAGNPTLVPPQSWLMNFEANRSLGKAGSIKFKIDAEAITDIVDQIPVNGAEEAPGNLKSAQRLRMELNTSLLLDTIGFKGAKIDTALALQRSWLRDPLTRETRPISNRGKYGWNVEFRHDIPATQWAWGFGIDQNREYPFYRLDYFSTTWFDAPMAGIFIEHKNIRGLKAKLQVYNLAGQSENSRERFYVGRRDGPVDFVRDTKLQYGFIYNLKISGTF